MQNAEGKQPNKRLLLTWCFHSYVSQFVSLHYNRNIMMSQQWAPCMLPQSGKKENLLKDWGILEQYYSEVVEKHTIQYPILLFAHTYACVHIYIFLIIYIYM